jgi:tetratricopeptide (TPR) repeat protein
LALSVLLCLWIGGCAVQQERVYVKDGQAYGVTSSRIWRGRWWNYYERGVSYAAGDFWTEALADLQQAMAQRSVDQRRARTYGLHFIDYFPHRELGIVYYHLGRYAEAARELETSLHSVDTARAKFYLNKARQRQLEHTAADTSPPRIVVASPQDGLYTRDFTITVQGHVEDDTYVSAVAINGRAQFIELAEPRLAFQQEIALQDGANTLDLVAVDLVGKPARQRLTVTLDRHGPLVGLERVERLGTPPHQRLRLTGWLSDSSRVVRFVLAGRPLTLPPGQEWAWQEEVPLAPDMAALPFEAEDAAGNVTRGAIVLEPVGRETQLIREGTSVRPGLTHWASLAPEPVLSDLNAAGPRLPQVAQSSDLPPPVITLTNLAAQQTTYYDTVYLEGQVTAASPLTALTINNTSLWRRQGLQLFFGYIAALQPGDNRFVLEAVDQAGKRTHQEIVVHRKVAEVKRLDARLRITLLPLEKKGEATALAETVYDSLLTALLDQGRFQLVERDKLEAILREQKLSQAALVDADTAVRLGRIVGVEGILLGTVVQTPRALEVFARFVDVETGTILAAEDVYGEDLDLRAVRTLMEGLALEIRQRFPLVEGLVLKVEGNKVVVDLGHQQLKKYMKLIVFRTGAMLIHPITGKPLGTPTEILGEVTVEAVFDELSQGVLRPAKNPGDVKQLDHVITK